MRQYIRHRREQPLSGNPPGSYVENAAAALRAAKAEAAAAARVRVRRAVEQRLWALDARREE